VRRVVCLSLLAGCVLCSVTRDAAAGLAFPSVVERVTGARLDLAPVRASLSDSTARVRVEGADAELYGIDGLRSSGARAAFTCGAVFFSGSIIDVVSPVGSQARGVLEAGYVLRRRWQGAVRVGAERLLLDGNSSLTTHVAGVSSRSDVGRVSTVADVEVLDPPGAGYESSLSLAIRVRAGAAQLIGSIRIDGDRFVGAGIAAVARLHESLALLAGYDDGSESMRGAVVIDWRGIEVAAGVFQHPVLGMSQGVSVSCFR
jgi:hypothetical protein